MKNKKNLFKYEKNAFLFAIIFLIVSCKTASEEEAKPHVHEIKTTKTTKATSTKRPLSFKGLQDTLFINLREYSNDFVYDLKYATDDNFLKTRVYDCAECYVRVKTAKALITANKELMRKGYRIKFFDCYRPLDVQKKMWKIFPNPIYVADPAKGSIHNKGGAVDITLINAQGKELDMGTSFDFFGKQAYHAYQGFDKNVLDNRKLLKETMEKHGFWAITSEWWHYNLGALSNAKVANFKWDCP